LVYPAVNEIAPIAFQLPDPIKSVPPTPEPAKESKVKVNSVVSPAVPGTQLVPFHFNTSLRLGASVVVSTSLLASILSECTCKASASLTPSLNISNSAPVISVPECDSGA